MENMGRYNHHLQNAVFSRDIIVCPMCGGTDWFVQYMKYGICNRIFLNAQDKESVPNCDKVEKHLHITCSVCDYMAMAEVYKQ